MITFENWEIRAFGGLAHQYDNLSRRLEVLGDLPEGWEWTMLVQVDDHMDLIPLSPMEGGIGADLSREQLALAGIYELQLRGSQGDRVRHTNTEYVQVFQSLSGDSNWPEIPSEFTQIEQRIQEVNSHPPVPGEKGFWLVWSTEKDEYIESEYPLPSGNGSSSAGEDGGYYIPSLDETTGLLTFTASKEDMPAVSSKNVRGPQGEQGEAGPKGDKGDTGPQGPAGADGKDGAGMDLTGASVGQIAQIAAVDGNGIPTQWIPIDLPAAGNGEKEWRQLAAIDFSITENQVSSFTWTDLDDVTDIFFSGALVENSSATDSGFGMSINDSMISNTVIYCKKAGGGVYNYCHAHFNGLFWECRTSGSSTLSSLVRPASDNAQYPYSVSTAVGKAKKLYLAVGSLNFIPVTGTMSIWVR